MSLSFRVRARRGDFSLDVAFAGDVRSLVVVGPSGAGKTTLLQGLAGLGPVDEVHLAMDGQVLIDSATGAVPPAHRRGVGYLFQEGRLFPHLNVEANVSFARPYATDPMDVAEALGLVDLDGFETRWPATLSGGEMRRVAFARAIAARPRILLLDEPFAGLDVRRRDALIPYLIRLRDEVGTPMVIVTHDPRDVSALSQAVLRIEDGRAAARPEPA
ncbi:Sulfate/thiosulfate import ATP-binding protein CysA [Brevundimonas sp. NIBR10]|uniref:ATP-binding cassette domain-containing protein n=1 Tax=Brevundimonas sp. NIBR10 TaxID=3015997 RepID=UPI0022F15E9E|nr:ATP-binding cassette domain-containing protein [Brevundimonas sp. NIBR10]WGM47734.1 Sulfate/thiosulfate import ATP-binding protein CysA [Brevundimonas sp. NIBR10]